MGIAPNPETGPILIATDFSDDSAAAFGWAARAARAFGAALHVLHVVHDPLDHPGSYSNHSGASSEKLEDVAKQLLDAWIEHMRAELPQAGAPSPAIASSLAVGLPETRIIEIAAREGARMIVMGGQGQSGLADRLLGSRAERVARHATIPVTIVRAPTHAADSSSADDA